MKTSGDYVIKLVKFGLMSPIPQVTLGLITVPA
jgi:hypothetical protein